MPSQRRIATKTKRKVLKPVHPNVGIAVEYKRRLKRLLDEMHTSVSYWVKATYNQNSPEIAQDASPSEILRAAIRKLTRRWTRNFNRAAQKLGAWFTQTTAQRSDAALKKILAEAGISVEFQMTRAQNDVIRATLNQQVALIKSIPQKYLSDVEGAVMRSVQTGRDIGALTKELQTIAGVSFKRAAFIAVSQNAMATAAMTRARQIETGITTAIWRHSSAGKTPRPTHVAMNGGEYDVVKGMWDEDERAWILPGQLLNCRCLSLSVVQGFSL